MTRPPRRPARAHPWAAFRPVVLIVGAGLLALFLLTATMRFVVRTSLGPAGNGAAANELRAR